MAFVSQVKGEKMKGSEEKGSGSGSRAVWNEEEQCGARKSSVDGVHPVKLNEEIFH